jgi:uncharacterized protein YyaL (SSP411 family)
VWIGFSQDLSKDLQMPNRLAGSTSPYLNQHKDNPVNWYPWGQEALSQAKNDNKPIFLSIGYAACHWCHVMAHESFEDKETAKILNENFISIKVDREERPDIDEIYMQAVVLLTGQGGWPLSVFLTPDLKPFYGGTYFPPIPKFGMPSFNQVLLSVVDVYKNKPESIENNAEIITQAVKDQYSHSKPADQEIDLDQIVDSLFQSYDWQDGGWGNAPKFPQPMVIEFLIQRAINGSQDAYRIVEHFLNHMSRGGMYDLVGGGFHRYSTDSQWLIPHFEKMLYDNAQLALAYLHGYFLTGNIYFRHIAVKTLEFIQTEMTSPEGGFYASLDADTPEGEGRYYSWNYDQLQELLSDEEFSFLQSILSLSNKGNFESRHNVLQFTSDVADLAEEMKIPVGSFLERLEPIFGKLAAIREKRIAPNKDQKIITEWNALAIKAFAAAGLLLNRDDFLDSARKAAGFIIKEIQTPSGHLYRSWGRGKPSQPATLSDYSGMILALHAMYEVDFEPETFINMKELFQIMQDEFASSEGLYFDTAESVTDLILRPISTNDNAIPSGNALAGHVHWIFANYQESPDDNEKVSEMLSHIAEKSQQFPTSFGSWLSLADLNRHATTQVALISEEGESSLQQLLEIYRGTYRANHVIAARIGKDQSEEHFPVLLCNREPLEGKPTAYVCHAFTCQKPTTDINTFRELLA